MKKLGFAETEKLLKRFQIPVASQFLVKNEFKALDCAKKLGFPVALKLSSPDIIHKTEVKGVFLNLKNEKELSIAFHSILKNARKLKKASIEGVLIQKQLKGREVIVGSKLDPAFGPVIMFGLGGIFVEVLKDVTFRLVPIQRKDAREMLQEIKGFPILKRVRGEKSISFEKMEDFLLKVSKMIEKNPRIKELDINPAFAGEKSCLAADVRILV